MSSVFSPTRPLDASFRTTIARTLDNFVDDRAGDLSAIDTSLRCVAEAARSIAVSGKHIRPAFAWWGRVAVDADVPDADCLLRAVASLDLLHAGLLVHDDLIDGADTRRGEPAAHVRFAAEHREAAHSVGDANTYGQGGAVLVGALLMEWSTALFDSAGLQPVRLAAARPLLARMRQEVLAGQLLDLRAQHGLAVGTQTDAVRARLDAAEQIVRYKTALYTVARPLQLGAILGGSDADLVEELGHFGIPLGRAYQWRDDLLDVFGDASVTGKPVGQDLRDGKPTLLVAEALAHADGASTHALCDVLGKVDASDAEIETARQILVDTGARERVEHAIARDYAAALRQLDDLPITPDGRTALAELARQCVERDR